MSSTNFIQIVKKIANSGANIAYWMNRDQRVSDNRALFFAQEKAIERQKPLFVFFNLVPDFLGAKPAHYAFMIENLKQVEKILSKKNINFILTTGEVEKTIPELVKKYDIDLLVTDFNPLKIKKHWINSIKEKINTTIIEVDAHNIIPCWITSGKQEFAARTIRPKIHAKLHDYLEELPEIKQHPYKFPVAKNSWEAADTLIKNSKKIAWPKPGESEAKKVLQVFIDKKLNDYADKRNDPTKEVLSNLSPYLHFGQISSQRAVIEVLKSGKKADEFIEEITVRKELSDNFCYYNENYDNFEGFPDWAKKTLNEHRADVRPYLYSLEEFETAKTHDELWNAAQLEMVTKGKMHGYMRMYWAKKILEWTPSPEKAMEIAIYLNDKYELDGRDPNGYVGIAWSIGGVHDRAWNERPVLGKIRYMSYNGAKSKFDVGLYIKTYLKK